MASGNANGTRKCRLGLVFAQLFSSERKRQPNKFLGVDFWEGDAMKHFSVKKRIFSEKRGGHSVNEGFGKDSSGKAIQWRGPGHSVNRQTLKTEKLLSSSPSRKSALSFSFVGDHPGGHPRTKHLSLQSLPTTQSIQTYPPTKKTPVAIIKKSGLLLQKNRSPAEFHRKVLLQISFEPGFRAYQRLAQQIKVPFSRIVSFEGVFKTRAKTQCAPNSRDFEGVRPVQNYER